MAQIDLDVASEAEAVDIVGKQASVLNFSVLTAPALRARRQFVGEREGLELERSGDVAAAPARGAESGERGWRNGRRAALRSPGSRSS
jgi:hypothetical protein